MRERQIHDAFEAWLRKLEIPFLHSRMDKAATIAKGWPDYSVFFMARCLFIEFKTTAGKLSPDQEKVIAHIRKSGNTVVVTTSVEQAIEACKSILLEQNALQQAPGSGKGALRQDSAKPEAPTTKGRATRRGQAGVPANGNTWEEPIIGPNSCPDCGGEYGEHTTTDCPSFLADYIKNLPKKSPVQEGNAGPVESGLRQKETPRFCIAKIGSVEYVMAPDRENNWSRIRVASAVDVLNLPRWQG